MKTIELKPIAERSSDWDEIERKIKKLFREEIYLPLLEALDISPRKLTNAESKSPVEALYDAIRSGRITYYRGYFTGKLSAEITKELKRRGAQWDDNKQAFHLPQSNLPNIIKQAISDSETAFKMSFKKIEDRLNKILPEEIAKKLNISEIFDTALWKVEKKFADSIRSITIASKLTDEERKNISEQWATNMQYDIKKWMDEEVIKVRKQVQAYVFEGGRAQGMEGLFKIIGGSKRVSDNKAKFLARQETRLLMAKYKEARYTSAGITEYKWRCVLGAPNHPVRPMHKALDGTIQRWDNPPIVDKKGDRKNPGEDYNCRCTASPIVKF